MKRELAFLVLGAAFGCSCSDGDGRPDGGASQAGRGGAAGSAGSGVSGVAGTSAGRGGTGSGGTRGALGGEGGASGEQAAGAETTGGEAGEASAGEGGAMPEFVPLPTGSRERAFVLNLVDADAAAEVEEFLDDDLSVEESLQLALNLFLEHYAEDYDFVYLFTERRLDSTAAGRFTNVNRPAMPGLGYGMQYDSDPTGHRTSGRTRGVIGVQYATGSYGGPLAHELFHHWGTHFGAPFGVGYGDENHGPHWGYTGLKGVHGGFDASTLRCTVPEGALPPSCTAEANGRYRYWVDLFGANDNGVATPFSPLELYMIGLVPLSAVPESIALLSDATALYDTYVETTNELIVEASGITALDRDDFVETYGTALELGANERSFTAAFVVVSATPVADSVLDEVGTWAAIFGNRGPASEALSFEELTGGRATLDTRLGARRRVDQPVPAPWAAEGCDTDEQDCADGRACFFGLPRNLCGLSRGGQRDAPCDEPSDCAPGLDCIESGTGGDPACEPYCSPDQTAENACGSLCPWFIIRDENGDIVAGVCQAP